MASDIIERWKASTW